MNKQRILLYVYCLLSMTPSYSKDTPKEAAESSRYTLNAVYSYADYSFKSYAPQGNADFHGYSNLYLGGANNFKLGNNLRGGIFLFNMDTFLNINQNPQVSTHQKINNNTLFAHVLKPLNANWFFDLTGGYGQSTSQYTTYSFYSPLDFVQGNAKAHGNDWFGSAKFFYTHAWNKFKLISNAGFLYAQASQQAFSFNQSNFVNSAPIPKLRTNNSFLVEGVEIYYQTPAALKPFVNGGLIQVLDSSNNRPAAAAVAIGSFPNPNFSLNRNGFNAGGGLAYKYKKMDFKLAQLYYQRGTVYHSNQTILSVSANMD